MKEFIRKIINSKSFRKAMICVASSDSTLSADDQLMLYRAYMDLENGSDKNIQTKTEIKKASYAS